jgi:hypothetical protein
MTPAESERGDSSMEEEEDESDASGVDDSDP